MNAVVDIQGVQFRVAPGDRIRAPRMDAEPGSKVSIDKVLLLDEDSQITVGKPLIEDATVESTVQGHGREKKIIVFKMKRRKGYRVKNGHRQHYTLLQIDDISYSGSAGEKEAGDQTVAEPVSEENEE